MATTMNNSNNLRLLEDAEGHNGDGHLYEQSPAYKALLEIGLIARQYRIKDAEQIECRRANSDNCTMCCCNLLCVTNCGECRLSDSLTVLSVDMLLGEL
jgi:hypothetical protein